MAIRTIFLTAYILTAPITGAFAQTDINNLKTIFSNLGIITKIVNHPPNHGGKTVTLTIT